MRAVRRCFLGCASASNTHPDTYEGTTQLLATPGAVATSRTSDEPTCHESAIGDAAISITLSIVSSRLIISGPSHQADLQIEPLPFCHVLVPVSCTEAALTAYGVAVATDLAEVLREQSQQDPLFAQLLADATSQRLEGQLQVLEHRTPCVQTSKLMHCAVTASTWTFTTPVGVKQELAAVQLLIEYSPSNPEGISPSYQWEQPIMAHITWAVSILDPWGQTFKYQNAASTKYFGHVSTDPAIDDPPPGAQEPGLHLQLLFTHEPGELQGMVTSVRAGKPWRKVIMAPVQGLSKGVPPTSIQTDNMAPIPESQKVLLCSCRRSASVVLSLLSSGQGLSALTRTSGLIPSEASSVSTRSSFRNASMSNSSNLDSRRITSASNTFPSTQSRCSNQSLLFSMAGSSQWAGQLRPSIASTSSQAQATPRTTPVQGALVFTDLPDALATSGWRHARLRSGSVRRRPSPSCGSDAQEMTKATSGLPQTPRIALMSMGSAADALTSPGTGLDASSSVRQRSLQSFPSGRTPLGPLSLPEGRACEEYEHHASAITMPALLRPRITWGPMNPKPPEPACQRRTTFDAQHTFQKQAPAPAPADCPSPTASTDVWVPAVRQPGSGSVTPALELRPSATAREAAAVAIRSHILEMLDTLVVGLDGEGCNLVQRALLNNPVLLPARSHVYLEITASPMLEPGTDKPLLLLTQNDVTQRVEAEKSLAELTDAQLSLLEGMFPRHVLQYMTLHSHVLDTPEFAASLKTLAAKHDGVTVFFMDVCDFTQMSKQVEPYQVMTLLSQLFLLLDDLVDEWGLYKIETAGDAYLVAGNLMTRDNDGFMAIEGPSMENGSGSFLQPPSGSTTFMLSRYDVQTLGDTSGQAPLMADGGYLIPAIPAPPPAGPRATPFSNEDTSGKEPLTAAALGAHRVFCFAREVLRVSKQVLMPHSGQPVRVRIGLHTGDLVSGVIGTKLPKFGCFGDTMNTGARMEQTSRPGCIQMSSQTRILLPSTLAIPATGGVEVKGKGVMETFIWDPESNQTSPDELVTMAMRCKVGPGPGVSLPGEARQWIASSGIAAGSFRNSLNGLRKANKSADRAQSSHGKTRLCTVSSGGSREGLISTRRSSTLSNGSSKDDPVLVFGLMNVHGVEGIAHVTPVVPQAEVGPSVSPTLSKVSHPKDQNLLLPAMRVLCGSFRSANGAVPSSRLLRHAQQRALSASNGEGPAQKTDAKQWHHRLACESSHHQPRLRTL